MAPQSAPHNRLQALASARAKGLTTDTEPRAQATGTERDDIGKTEDFAEMRNSSGNEVAKLRGSFVPLARRLRSGLCIYVVDRKTRARSHPKNCGSGVS